MEKFSDVVIVGSGIAALQTAKLLSAHMNVTIITKSNVRSSNSYYAQGGIAAVIAEKDTAAEHISDTIKAGEHHCSAQAVQELVEEGSIEVKQWLEAGFPADRKSDGTLSLGLEGAHSRCRIVHAGGDATGKTAIEYLLASLPDNVTVKEQEMAFDLIIENGVCRGVKAKTAGGDIYIYRAAFTILATGGAGSLYTYTSNQPAITGDGIALAYRAGAAVTDMEFMQFHPTLLYMNGQTKGLVSEAVRGAGAVLVDESGRRIMNGIHPMADLAPRHITAFEIYQNRQNGHEVFLDISMIDRFDAMFPTIAAMCRENGVDLARGKIPVAPGSHFLMGGIQTNTSGQTTIPHLYAVGEAACTGVHGANRLASNSLLEGMAFGKKLAEAIAAEKAGFVEPAPAVFFHMPAPAVSFLPRKELQSLMMENAGLIRTADNLTYLTQLLEPFALLEGDISHFSWSETEQLFMHTTGWLIARAALMREETRGAHIRSDFPVKKPGWSLKWITAKQKNWLIRSDIHESNQARRNAESVF